MQTPKQRERGAQTVHRALRILECFTSDTPQRSMTEVSQAVGLTAPTTFRLLRTLEAHQMVISDKSSHRYSLGPGIMRLASVILERDDLLAVAQPVLSELRQVTGETTSLHRLVGRERVCLLEFVSNHPIKMTSGVGRTYPLHRGAAGKAMLAWMEPGEVDAILEEAQRQTGRGDPRSKPLARTKLLADLEQVRTRGYAISVGETVAGASAIATPLFDSSGRPIAAINTTGPVERWTPEAMAQAASKLLEGAALIMSHFGLDPARPPRS